MRYASLRYTTGQIIREDGKVIDPDDIEFIKWIEEGGVLEVENLAPFIDAMNQLALQPEIFTKPIRTPALYADDVFVSSRKIKDDPGEAFDEAMNESGKGVGVPKSLDLISRSTLKALERSREEIKELKKTVVDLTKEVERIRKKVEK